MEHLPLYIPALFILATVLTVWLYSRAVQRPTITIIVLTAWLVVQGAIGLSGFYRVTDTLPPRLLLLLGPPMVFIALLFVLPQGRKYIDALSVEALTLLHVIRALVEPVLYWLSVYKYVPVLMTFEGQNPDILSGLSAPVVYYFVWVRKKMSTKALLVWNIACLILLINIVVRAVLAAPTSIQQIGFEQPNVGILYFPFVWLPCCVVPIVLLAHLVSIRQLVRRPA